MRYIFSDESKVLRSRYYSLVLCQPLRAKMFIEVSFPVFKLFSVNPITYPFM